MKALEEIEDELAEAYAAFHYSQLKTWTLEQLLTRKEEITHLRDRLTATYGKAADAAIGTLLCEYYDLDDEVEIRSFQATLQPQV
ncbi:hypothetical protein [Hymenobacter sp. BT491]|uniref:hypothetical protein n=1 Tax=Hymenobacter sp. BT491 TaxID=2766779 RepID=UPI0016534355|nr:hypothetical protein [Hymenobacter sp. BT491]MBC6988961.1 hypothetical protein [Hymenobacter sp. BT491]